MSRRPESEATEQPSTSESEVRLPLNRDERNEEPPESVTLGVGSRSRFVETGHEPGAPVDPQLGRKALITTLVATLVFALVYAVLNQRWITLDDLPI